MKNYLLTLTICLFASFTSLAQQDLTLFNFNDIPQSSYSNPANQFNGKFFLGLPGISSSYYSVSNSGFAYSDFIKKDGDSLRIDFNSMIGELEEKNFLSFNTKVDLISFGFKLGERTQIMFNATENINLRFNYSRDLVTFIHKGNLAFQDNRANFDGTGFSANYYREYGVGISHQFGDRLRAGVRLKYLYGIANLDSKKSDLTLSTDPNTYALTSNADVLINTSGSLDSISNQNGFISGFDNNGFGIDLGMNYELTKKLSINASVIDLGFIDWGSNVTNYTIEKGQYYYEGIQIESFSPQDDTTNTAAFDRVADSLEAAFDLKETNESYTTPLVGRIYIGANYKLNDNLMVGGLIQSEFFKGLVKPSFTASANYKLTKWIGLAASYSMINRSFNNLGVGLNLNPGPIQIYVVSDNVLSAFRPQHARHAQVRVGINLIFGSEKVKEINPSFNGVKEPRIKKEKEGKEVKEIKQPETTPASLMPEPPPRDTILERKKGAKPVEKTDSALQNKTDSTTQSADSAKSTSKKTIIEAVEENQKKIKEAADSLNKAAPKKEMTEPMIHPTQEKAKSDSASKATESKEKKVEPTKQEADSTTKKEIIEPMIHPTPEEPKADSVGKATESMKKSLESAEPKVDSIPPAVPTVPKKEEPVVDPQ
jgi:hypothetical protein